MNDPFKLDDVVVIKTPNDCKWCERRVNSYLESVKDWQRQYDSINEKLAIAVLALQSYRSFERDAGCNSSVGQLALMKIMNTK